MITAIPLPPFTPPQARPMTISELAENYESIKPIRGNLRITFQFLRFRPSGVLRSIEETGPGRLEVTVSLTPLRRKKYSFEEGTDVDAGARCWVWSPLDERTTAAVGAAGA